MKIVRLTLVALICLCLTSCSLFFVSRTTSEKIKNGVPVSEQKNMPLKIEIPAKTKEEKAPPLRVGWVDAFKADIEKVIRTYGRYEQNSEYGMVKGLKYGKLVDFEMDSIPELVLLHDLTVKVYRFDGKQSNMIYEKKLGSRFGQTDVSYTFAINEKSATPCLITYQTQNEWWSESFAVLTVQNGKIYEKVLEADAYLPDKNADSPCDVLHTFFMDGQNINESDYYVAKNEILTGKTEIDACYDTGFGTDIPASKAELNMFLEQFKL